MSTISLLLSGWGARVGLAVVGGVAQGGTELVVGLVGGLVIAGGCVGRGGGHCGVDGVGRVVNTVVGRVAIVGGRVDCVGAVGNPGNGG